MSICPYAQELRCHWYVHYTRKSMDDGVGGTMFLGDGGWGGQHSMSLCNVRIWRSQVKKQVLNTEKERTRKSCKTHIGEPSLARLGLPLNQQRTISDTCSTRPTCTRNAHRHTGTWCTIGMCTMFNALFVTILSLAHVSDTASYCKIGILSLYSKSAARMGSYFRVCLFSWGANKWIHWFMQPEIQSAIIVSNPGFGEKNSQKLRDKIRNGKPGFEATAINRSFVTPAHQRKALGTNESMRRCLDMRPCLVLVCIPCQ